MAASKASVWKGFISFGLVSFPVRLHTAARGERVQFHMLHRKDLSRIKEVRYCAAEDKPLESADIVKGFETSKGKYVVVEDDELKAMAPPTARTMEILQFVGRDAVDPIYFETSYYVAPDGAMEKPYALFLAALEQTEQDAIAKVAMHNREHVVLIRPADEGLVQHTLYYATELHRANRVRTSKSKYSPRELKLAKSLVEHLSAPFKPEEFHDIYKENVEKLIRAKGRGQEIVAAAQPPKAPVVDLMEALKRSLAANKGAGARGKRLQPPKRRAA